MAKIPKSYWTDEIARNERSIVRMQARAKLFQDVLDTVPLGTDQKSREVREDCEHWIYIEQILVPRVRNRIQYAKDILTNEYQ